MSKHGQEIIINDWQIGIQNLLRLVLLSLLVGLAAALLWWSLRATKYSLYYFFLYWYSWVYCHIPFGCSDTANYNLQVLRPTIDRLAEVFATCRVIFAFASIVAGIGFRYYFVLRGQKLSEERYLRGAKLLKPSELNAEIDASRDNNGRLEYVETALDLWVGREQIRIPARLTYLHLVAAGVSGTGKTQFINSLLKQLEEKTRQKCLILDLNGQYYSRFGRAGDKIISLYDQRSEAWSFYKENVPPEFFAEAMVELNDSGNKFFTNAGRALMTDVISLNTSVQGVWRDLTTKPAELLPKLDGGISPGLLGAPEQAAGVIASASVEMNFLRHLNYWNRSEDFFSITDWVLNQDSEWVFLIVKDIDLAAVKPLMRLWFDLAVGGVLQREEKKDYPHLWIVCDELPGLGMLPSFGKLLSQGRKYKATLVAGYQVQGQIRHLYGKDQAEEIFSGLQNKFIFRTPDPNAAKEESATLGEQDVEEISSGIQFGAAPTSDRNSLNRSIKTRPVVMASELQNLPDLTAYVKLGKFHPSRIRFDYQAYPELNAPSLREIPPTTTKPERSEPTVRDSYSDSWELEPAEIEDDSEGENDDTIQQESSQLKWDIDPYNLSSD